MKREKSSGPRAVKTKVFNQGLEDPVMLLAVEPSWDGVHSIELTCS